MGIGYWALVNGGMFLNAKPLALHSKISPNSATFVNVEQNQRLSLNI